MYLCVACLPAWHANYCPATYVHAAAFGWLQQTFVLHYLYFCHPGLQSDGTTDVVHTLHSMRAEVWPCMGCLLCADGLCQQGTRGGDLLPLLDHQQDQPHPEAEGQHPSQLLATQGCAWPRWCCPAHPVWVRPMLSDSYTMHKAARQAVDAGPKLTSSQSAVRLSL